MNRRNFIATSAITTSSAALASACRFAGQHQEESGSKTVESKPAEPSRLDPDLVKKFVGVSHGNLKMVKELIAGEPQLATASWDWNNGDWETGLGAASHVGSQDVANFLLDHGARIDVFAMTMLGHTEMVKTILLTYPETHAVPGPHGIPLLSHAIFGKDQADEVFNLLIERGADVNLASNSGQTPLMASAATGRVPVVKQLLESGADPNLKDKKNRPAIEYARNRKHAEIVKILEPLTEGPSSSVP